MRLLACVVAGGAAVAVYALPFRLNIVVAIVIAVLACLLLERQIAARRTVA